MVGVLEGKRALVTGASKGIGRAICHALVAEGALVTGIARASNELGSLSAELGACHLRANQLPHSLQSQW